MQTKAPTKKAPIERRPAPAIPRRDWLSHPNYPDQTLLLASHESFRRISRYITDAIADSSGDSAEDEAKKMASRGHFHRYFVRWKSAMRSHEAYEEGKLYPYLETTYDVSLDYLRRGHRELGALERAIVQDWRAGNRAALARALGRHDAVLLAHLQEEEDAVIPLLLAMSPEEFDFYYYNPIWVLLGDSGDSARYGRR